VTRDIEKRLAKIEAGVASPTGDLGDQIIAARKSLKPPRQTLAELKALAKEKGLTGRIARARLRMGFFHR
jgi:hypothetical protein